MGERKVKEGWFCIHCKKSYPMTVNYKEHYQREHGYPVPVDKRAGRGCQSVKQST
jgi:hypothetical protein